MVNARDFIRRFNLPRCDPPARVYIHSDCFGIFPEDNELSISDIANQSLDYFRRTLALERTYGRSSLVDRSSYLVGIVHGGTPRVILAGYNVWNLSSWPSGVNVEFSEIRFDSEQSRTRTNSPYIQGEDLLVLGLEEAYRRTTPNLKTYIEGKMDVTLRDVLASDPLLNGRTLTTTLDGVF